VASSPLSPDDRRGVLAAALIVFASFAVYATVRAPIPAVNEPHYLCKARHFWDPSWCARDFFLESSNAHYVFYATWGLLAAVCDFPLAAWIGRVLGWALLAFGWTALARQIASDRRVALWSAWMFLGLQAIGSFSGEWVVGGIEAKVVSYACVLLSLAALFRGQTLLASAWAGIATSFHPVIGIWNLAALLLGGATGIVTGDLESTIRVRRASPLKRGLLLMAIFAACALPGILPAVSVLRDADPKLSHVADEIQVYVRLSHHLDPSRFPLSAYLGYAALAVGWCIAQRGLPTKIRRMANAYVVAALVILVGGLVVGWWPRWPEIAEKGLVAAEKQIPHQNYAGLMKFYPFRLADAMLPILGSLAVAAGLNRAMTGRTRGAIAWSAAALIFAGSLLSPAIDRNPSRMTPEKLAAWIETCEWARESTAADALFVTPVEGWAFKWYAQRAEYLNYKDCPQDAKGIVEWQRRRWAQYRWQERHRNPGTNRYSANALPALAKLTSANYLIVTAPVTAAAEPIYRNAYFAVYRLDDGAKR
jgi:hypothetical protein